MKLKLFLLTAVLVLSAQVASNASISVEQTMSEQYLRNNGYSEQIYDTMQLGRARALGKPYYGEKETKYLKSRGPLKFLRRLHAYVDPAKEDYSFYHHDINPEPSYTDF
jgi:hypothetical protein